MKVQSFLKEFSIYGIGGVISRFIGVITAPIYTRLLNAEGYGLLDLITSISAILLLLLTVELPTGYGRSYYEAKNINRHEHLRGSIMLYFLGSYLLLIVAFISSYPFLNRVITTFNISLLIPVVLQVLPVMIITLTLVTIRFERDPITYAKLSIGTLVLSTAGGIFSVAYLKMGVSGILWANTLSSFVVCILLYIFIPKYTRFKLSFSYLKEVFLYSAPILPATIGTWLNQYIGRFFIASSLSLHLLGVYSIAMKVGLIMMLAVVAFKETWSPRAVMYFSKENSETRFSVMMNYYIIAFTALVVAIVTASPLVVRVLAPEDFYSAVPLVGIICVGYFWEGAKNILAAGNNWARKTYQNSVGSIFGGLCNILILYFFLEDFGLPAAAIGLTIGLFVQAMFFLITSQRNHYIPYSYLIIFKTAIILPIYSLIAFFAYYELTPIEFSVFVFMLGLLMFHQTTTRILGKSYLRKLLSSAAKCIDTRKTD